jgi:hypothetical protein
MSESKRKSLCRLLEHVEIDVSMTHADATLKKRIGIEDEEKRCTLVNERKNVEENCNTWGLPLLYCRFSSHAI